MKKTYRSFAAYVATAVPFLLCDFTWISLMNARLYKPGLGEHLAATPDWRAIALFYPLYFIGIVAFIVRPMQEHCRAMVFLRGLLFGIVAYATYDLTNQATLSDWPWKLSFIDMAWGGFVTAVAAKISRLVVDKMPCSS